MLLERIVFLMFMIRCGQSSLDDQRHSDKDDFTWPQSALSKAFRQKRASTPPVNKEELLNFHNQLRRGEGSSNMNKLQWDDKLASHAQKYAEVCNFEHPDYVNQFLLGQNLYFGSGTLTPTNLSVGVQAWFDEKKDYNFNSKSCRGVCAHYTTLTRHDFLQVGCGVAFCKSLSAFGRNVEDAVNFNCEYYAKEKFTSDYPFLKGAECSKCASGDTCENKLCVAKNAAAPGEYPEISSSSFIKGNALFSLLAVSLALI